ncbi:hypothetical protein CEUSTIGMA_g4850.t1 [Chlamydomonas eustigma]|uniref:B30.2/SPRY domain-containing protein n=1 Tax=Chlamydomonas eustigma TaxID=1157962 RepID=A0A250X2T6_9CHLO|nr:hypothetical protein CEUSTIGMA_g4850.t1 [Chlamydomonas eustigma]|eukprot:GAX77404.1 hypothetical protein CEUSTIGMA_g4850.t1 [Chlamydomonas eustigma]
MSSDDYVLLPTELNTAAQGYGLEVYRDKLTVHYRLEARHTSDVGAIQANRPVPLLRLLYYFEISVLEHGDLGRIAIGFTDRAFKLTRQPGWDPGSYGYHGDDGKKYGGNGKGEEYGPKFTKGDVIGACYHLGRQEIYFTKNGTKLRTAFRNVKGELFPTVGLHSKGELISVNFGQQPFKYDIETAIQEEKAGQAAAVNRQTVQSYLLPAMVREYLLHYGYGETLHAYDSETMWSCCTEDDVSGERDDEVMEDVVGDVSGGACSDPQTAGASCRMAIDSEPSETANRADQECSNSVACDFDSKAGQWALAVRQEVRHSLMRGDVKGAIERIQAAGFSQVLHGPDYEVVQYHLAVQQYIELIRNGDIDSAVTFAQSTLSVISQTLSKTSASNYSSSLKPSSYVTLPLSAHISASSQATGSSRSVTLSSAQPVVAQDIAGASSALGTASSEEVHEAARTGTGCHPRGSIGSSGSSLKRYHLDVLQEVIALIAYEEPEASPLGWLLGSGQRERVADAVNSAIAQAAGSPYQRTGVECLLRQIAAVQETLFEINGNQGCTCLM